MKHKLATRSDSELMLEKSFGVERRETPEFTGYVTRVDIHKAKRQAVMRHEEHAWLIIDDHYKWIQFFPEHSASTVTLMMDDRDRIVIRYIDICLAHGIDPDTGIPWYDDLYLDIVVTPEGTVYPAGRGRVGRSTKRRQNHARAARFCLAGSETHYTGDLAGNQPVSDRIMIKAENSAQFFFSLKD
ncbi:DUF402 domain-containing protein [Tumebacillus avium]|nr:DUF402 domain-containing protein [Tumebacillus avium]